MSEPIASMTEGNVTEIVEKIESLPDGVSVGGLQNVPDSDVCCFELDVTTDDLKSLAAKVKSQAEVIREMREALESYAWKGNWHVLPGSRSSDSGNQLRRFYNSGESVNGYDKAKAVLDKYKHQ